MTTPNLQGAIEIIRQVIIAIGPAPARDIERHPDVVAACRSSKTKARRHIERLHQLGHVRSCGSLQQPKYSVVDSMSSAGKSQKSASHARTDYELTPEKLI